jgi:hypothetical protein
VTAVVFASWFAYKTIKSNNDVEHARERQVAALARQEQHRCFSSQQFRSLWHKEHARSRSPERERAKLFPSLRQRLRRLTSPPLSKALGKQFKPWFFATDGNFARNRAWVKRR